MIMDLFSAFDYGFGVSGPMSVVVGISDLLFSFYLLYLLDMQFPFRAWIRIVKKICNYVYSALSELKKTEEFGSVVLYFSSLVFFFIFCYFFNLSPYVFSVLPHFVFTFRIRFVV